MTVSRAVLRIQILRPSAGFCQQCRSLAVHQGLGSNGARGFPPKI